MAAEPIVSVLMPVLNAGPFLADAVGAILGQTFGDFELIIVDDGSSDGSVDVAAAFAARDPRVRCLGLQRDPATRSGARASNAGLALARGRYIARTDADDVSTPGRLKSQVELLESGAADVCGGQFERIGDRRGRVWCPQTHEAALAELQFRAAFPMSTLMARADVLRRARFGEAEAFEDTELQMRLAFEARLGSAADLVLQVRLHPTSVTRRFSEEMAASQRRLRFAYFFRRFPRAPLDAFRALETIARKVPARDSAQLALAGRWLVGLSRSPEVRSRERMARRWIDACTRFRAAQGDARMPDEQQVLDAILRPTTV